MPDLTASAYEFGPYRLEPATRTLLRGDDVLDLPPKAVEVLTELIKRQGNVVGKQVLMDAVWAGRFVEEGNLTQMIFLLRRALGDRGGDKGCIQTVPRRGYLFAAEARPVESRFHCRIDSIAVLPLANRGGDPAEEYFADGITEALIANLAKVRQLRVVSRTSVMRYKGCGTPVPEIARALRVDAVVEGSVLRSNGHVRITARLIHAATDRHLWAQTFDEEASDILAMESRIARAIADEVRAKLGDEEEADLSRARRVRPEAHSLYLKGRFFARTLSEEAQRKAIRYFEDAIRADAEYAPPHAAIAESFILLCFFFGMVPKEAFAEAKAAAEKAILLDESVAEAHAALGLIRLLNDWDSGSAEVESRRALELAPGDSYVHWRRGMFLEYAGRPEEAVAELRRAEQLDPFSLVTMEEAGWPLYFSRRFDEAVAQFRKPVELAPDWDVAHYALGLALIQQANYAEAIQELRTATRLSGGAVLMEASLAYAYGRAGRGGEARDIVQRLTAKDAYVPQFFVAVMWAGLGEKDRAFESLETAFTEHEPCVVSAKVDPMLDPLRADPRFSDLVRRIGV